MTVQRGTKVLSVGSIAASGVIYSSPIELQNARTLVITCRVTYGAGTTGITVKLLYTPDEEHYDTIAYTSFVPTWATGGTVQRTIVVDPPEVGEMKVKVTNDDGSVATGKVDIWYSVGRWPE